MELEEPSLELIRELIKGEADPEVYAMWLNLFYEYNSCHEEHKVRMGCLPCYRRVYLWKKELLKSVKD